jgi:hypothetical protein
VGAKSELAKHQSHAKTCAECPGLTAFYQGSTQCVPSPVLGDLPIRAKPILVEYLLHAKTVCQAL